MKGASMSSVCIFGGEKDVRKRISHKKTVDATLKGALLLASKKKTKGKGKKLKGDAAKSPVDPAKSKADGKGGSKAAKAKKAKVAAKAKAKKSKAEEETGSSDKKETGTKGDVLHDYQPSL